jgi:hypothetical protein
LSTAVQRFLDYKAGKDLARTVPQAVEPVEMILKALETDMAAANERRRSFLSARRAFVAQRYRADLEAHASREALRTDADLVAAAEDQWELFQSVRPDDGLNAMRKALGALSTFAGKEKKSTEDVSALAAAVDSFAQRAQQVSMVVLASTAK